MGWAATGRDGVCFPPGMPGLLPHSCFSQAVSEVWGRLGGVAAKAPREMLQRGILLYSENRLFSAPLEPLTHGRSCCGAVWRLTSGTKLKMLFLSQIIPLISFK